MANPHLQSILSAVRYDKALKQALNQYVGTKENPRGKILAAFRRAHKSLAGNWENQDAIASIAQAYQASVLEAAGKGLQKSTEIGSSHLNNMLGAYDLPAPVTEPIYAQQDLAAIMAIVDNQNQVMLSGAVTEAQFLGGASRLGMFAPGLLQAAASSRMITSSANIVESGLETSLIAAGRKGSYVRQAIAAIDERTTECCLDVHGQIAEMDSDFITLGKPAYADAQEKPPFHDWCRTSQALVMKTQAADSLTRDMRRAATLEKELRTSKLYKAPHPANAFTRIRTARGVTIPGADKIYGLTPGAAAAVEAELAGYTEVLSDIVFESIDDAELWFIDNLPGLEDISLEGMHPKVAGRFASQMGQLEAKYGISGANGIRQIEVGTIPGAAGRYIQQPGLVQFSETLCATPDGFQKMMSEIGFKAGTGQIVPESFEEVVTHEIGHALEAKNANVTQLGHKEHSGFGDLFYQNFDGIEKNISRYALTDPSELAAEALVLFERGSLDQLNRAGVGSVVDIFEEWIQ